MKLSDELLDNIRELLKLSYDLGSTREQQKMAISLGLPSETLADKCNELSTSVYYAEKRLGIRGI